MKTKHSAKFQSAALVCIPPKEIENSFKCMANAQDSRHLCNICSSMDAVAMEQ